MLRKIVTSMKYKNIQYKKDVNKWVGAYHQNIIEAFELLLTAANIGSENVVINEKLTLCLSVSSSTFTHSLIRSTLELYLGCFFGGEKYTNRVMRYSGDRKGMCIITLNEQTELRNDVVLDNCIDDYNVKNLKVPLLKVILMYYQKKLNWKKSPRSKKLLDKLLAKIDEEIKLG